MKDVDGNECDLPTLCCRSPGWAANRIAHLTAQLAHAEADAEQAIHNEAFKEAQRIAEWLRTTSRAKGVLISIHSGQDIARLADDVASMRYREPT